MLIMNYCQTSDQIDVPDMFQQLQRIVGCTYISDLRHDENANELAKKSIRKMDLSGYSDAVIEDMTEYLYGDKSFRNELFDK